jgi:hypothetical protein
MAATSKLLTYEEWLKLPEVEGIEEVVNGEMRKMPPNKWKHARIVEQLAQLLRARLIPEAIYVVTSVFGLCHPARATDNASAGSGCFCCQSAGGAGWIHSLCSGSDR